MALSFPFLFILIVLPLKTLSATNCGFDQNVIPGHSIYLRNPNYPKNYAPATHCIWNLKTINGAQVFISCDLNLPGTSQICYGDKLSVSAPRGRFDREKKDYCGNSSFSLYSSENELSVELHATSGSVGGNFVCSATALMKANPNVPPQVNEDAGCDCGLRSVGKIAGGVETRVNEFPFMAALIYEGEAWCGTTIISQWHTLTAAHCVIQNSLLDVKKMSILVGDHNLNIGSDTNQSALYNVKSFIYHNAYDPKSYDNDIAILTAASAIIFGFAVGPICLPFRYTYEDFAGQQVTLLGWGLNEISGIDSPYLQKAQVAVVPPATCAAEWGDKPDTHVNNGKICGFSDTSDACAKDSGGPLIWYDSSSGRYQQLGIISFGVGCNSGYPSVNTRVSEYLQWIVTQTSGIRYCIK